jgi:hypothetical protein
MDFADDPWFAGFADGESHFGIDRRGAPRFMIALRLDDLGILEALCVTFGGNVSLAMTRLPHPNASWCVSGKRDLPGLVRYFDRFPLRSKKARDYVIWRRAVTYYCAHGAGPRGGVAPPYLAALRDALMVGRAYDGDVPDVAVIKDGQLRLEA